MVGFKTTVLVRVVEANNLDRNCQRIKTNERNAFAWQSNYDLNPYCKTRNSYMLIGTEKPRKAYLQQNKPISQEND